MRGWQISAAPVIVTLRAQLDAAAAAGLWLPVILSLPLTWCLLLCSGTASSVSGCAMATRSGDFGTCATNYDWLTSGMLRVLGWLAMPRPTRTEGPAR
jgi:hypothetical protein